MFALAVAVVLASSPAEHPQHRPGAWWVPLALGGAAIAGGVSLLVVANHQGVEASHLTGLAADDLRYLSGSNRVGGSLMLLFAACSAGLSAFLFGWDSPVSAALAPTPGGAAFALGWRL